jgi:M6 family metalloprotease-like protein
MVEIKRISISRGLLLSVLLFYLFTFLPLNASAQRRMPCTSVSQGALTRGTYYALPEPITKWDSHRVYRQPVVLIAFKDMNFSMSDPVTYYNRLLNEEGFNEGVGKGCVADYFREQSGGLLNLQFDVYGPFQVDTIAKGKGSSNDGKYPMMKAMEQLCVSCDADFSVYDWDGDGEVNQVVFIAAGYSGNDNTGYIWPNTYSCGFKAPGGLGIGMYSISCEKWKNDRLCGIGTICHEFAHSLGLPDIYPANVYGGVFSVVDEWDLMDGGNYTNYGWCPPNFSAMEKMFLGWSSPIELTTATTITGMKPVSEGGETYLIRNSGYENEFYLLENRRQTGWDYAAPGNGLLIFHVDYNYGMWLNNIVNTSMEHFCYDLFHADNKDYLIWDPDNNGKDPNKWTMTDRMRNSYLSTSAYPYTDPVSLVVNASLTDDSEPAATLFNDNADGELFMQKAITNIRVASDGSVSFDFMQVPSGIEPVPALSDGEGEWYDLQGRRLSGKPTHKGVFIHNRKKVAL